MTKIKTKEKKRAMKIILLFAVLAVLFFCGCNLTRVTKANYAKIHTGMSRESVIELLGTNYEVSSDASYGGHSSSIYVWESMGYSISVVFLNGEVLSKAQAG